jgi:integrase
VLRVQTIDDMTPPAAGKALGTDALGRRRSQATDPEFRKGKPPANKGRRLPAEVLTQAEMNALMAARSKRGPVVEARERAIVWLMYATGLKVGQIAAMERWHYLPEPGQVVAPGVQGGPDKTYTLDSVARELLADWYEERRRLGVGQMARLFCTVQNPGKGRSMTTTGIRTSLRTRAERAKIDRRVTPEGLRASGREHLAGRAATTEGHIEAYVNEVAFQARYPEAFRKWEDAHALYVLGPDRHAARIGLDCREALMLFANATAERLGVDLDVPPSHTVARLRAVTAVTAAHLGETATSFLDALVVYWGTISDLANRQVHSTERQGEDLTPEDARRLVFHTMLVMYEVDRAVGAAAPGGGGRSRPRKGA